MSSKVKVKMTTMPVKEAIKQRYGAIASKINEDSEGCTSSCCKSGSPSGTDPITRDLYVNSELTSDLPKNAIAASLGCGNPTSMVKILPGQTVLDLGSGTTSLDPFLQIKTQRRWGH